MLAQIGPRLRDVLRTDDVLARLGGDEFAVLLPGTRSAEEVGVRIARALEDRFPVEGIDVQIGASIGIAVFPQHGQDAGVLLRHADVAMYQAKTSRSGHAFYVQEQDRNTRERLELIGELRDAVTLGQLVVHYQPIVDLATGEVTEVEALVRWQHPERGLLAPGEFVPLAEQTGVMRQLTDHVLDTALAQGEQWRSEGLDIGVAVNVSASTLLEPGWADAVTGALERWSTPPARLRIEITEDALLVDQERGLAVVRCLGDAGVGVSLDDFGTGFSSLALLKQLAVDELKIDRTFVDNALDDSGRRRDRAGGGRARPPARAACRRRGRRGRGDAARRRRVGRHLRAGLLPQPSGARRGAHRAARRVEPARPRRSVDGGSEPALAALRPAHGVAR